MVLLNESGLAGEVLFGLSQNVTGSIFLSMLMIVFIIMLLFMLLRVPLEFTAILILPMLIVFMSIDNALLSVLGVFLIYLGVILGKNFFFAGD